MESRGNEVSRLKAGNIIKRKKKKRKEKFGERRSPNFVSNREEGEGKGRDISSGFRIEEDKCGKERAPAARVMKYSIGSRHSRRQGRVARDQPEGQVPLPRSLALPLPSDLS